MMIMTNEMKMVTLVKIWRPGGHGEWWSSYGNRRQNKTTIITNQNHQIMQ